MFGAGGKVQEKNHILTEHEIVDGIDELGRAAVRPCQGRLLVRLAVFGRRDPPARPYQNATGLQVSSAVLAGMVYALENPNEGILEADELDYKRCLEIQTPYLGPVVGVYTDWTPLQGRPGFFPEDVDESDPWQFRNILVR